MPRITRRAAAGIFAAGAAGALAGVTLTRMAADGTTAGIDNPTYRENMHRGSAAWQLGQDASRETDPKVMQIAGYASAQSVNLGETISFHVSVTTGEDYTVGIFRLGWYGGECARKLTQSPPLSGLRQAEPAIDVTTGMISCAWAPGWQLGIPSDWASGTYLAVFTTASGWRSFTPFVVRDDARRSQLCVIMPFTTYQAYNRWPTDGVRGRDLYYGYRSDGDITGDLKGQVVSFDRPYPYHGGLPSRFEYDQWFINWIEAQGFDLTYATSIDLHAGRIDPKKYAGLVFPGHDEYWSQRMIDVAKAAVAGGTSLAFMEANNVYWNIRLSPSADGRENRVMTCYKLAPDPAPGDGDPTTQWRLVEPKGSKAEQGLLGVQFNGQVIGSAPLVVQEAAHWFWAGTGVTNGDQIDGVVGGEADGVDPAFSLPHGGDVRRTLLSQSPYQALTGKTLMQNTSITESGSGAIVFASGSNDWPGALSAPKSRDPRIQRATANVLNRIVRQGGRQQ